MQRPSITFINRVYPPARGATGRVLRDLARAFAREGWRVTIITTGQNSVKERDGAVRVIRTKAPSTPKSIAGYLWVLFKLAFTALMQPADHIIVTMTDPPLLAVAGDLIRRIKKCRHIHWCQDMYPDLLPALGKDISPSMFSRLKNHMHNALKHCDRIIVIGRCMGRILSNEGHNPRLITFIPNWPDPELVSVTYNDKHVASQPASPPPHIYNRSHAKPHNQQIKAAPKFRVLYAGTLGLAHPIDTILDAAAILQETEPDIEFVFVGEGEGYDRLAQKRGQKHLDNIRLMPYQPVSHLRNIMESGDLHLISMSEDAAGLLVPCKLYSAFAAGRPCLFVGPAACETAKTIEDFKSGDILQQGEPQALAEAIARYVHDSQHWFNAQKGAIKAAQVYLPSQSIEAWIKRAWTVIEPDMKDARP